MVVFVDECVNLYKISNRQSRENNYEKLLSMFNDTMQGKVANLGIYMAGTPQFIEDERRGLYSYVALKSRLADSRFAKDGYIDFNSPIIRLQQLTDEEIFLLLERLTDVHAQHYGYISSIKDGNIIAFMQMVMGQLGADELQTPREITRDYLALLNIMQQDSSVTFEHLIHSDGFKISKLSNFEEHEEANDEFAMFEL